MRVFSTNWLTIYANEQSGACRTGGDGVVDVGAEVGEGDAGVTTSPSSSAM
jgi:hypothetical protein